MSITMQDLLKSGAHFGHQTRYWNPKMAPYIYGARNKIHIINLEHTVSHLGDALKPVAMALGWFAVAGGASFALQRWRGAIGTAVAAVLVTGVVAADLEGATGDAGDFAVRLLEHLDAGDRSADVLGDLMDRLQPAVRVEGSCDVHTGKTKELAEDGLGINAGLFRPRRLAGLHSRRNLRFLQEIERAPF